MVASERWQWPLVTWSILVAIVWPIVFFVKQISRRGFCP